MERVAYAPEVKVRPTVGGGVRERKVVLGRLIDELEEVIAGGLALPFTSQGLVDRERCLELIDLLRVSLPQDLTNAQRILQEEERLLAEARAQAAQVRSQAEKDANSLLEENQLVKMAELRSQNIIQEAEKKREKIIRAAESQAYQLYLQLEHHLDLLKVEVREAMASGDDFLE